jgi:adenylate cyclase class 2
VATETEVKLRAPEGAAEAKARIEALGVSLKTPRQLESDTLYDSAAATLRSGDQILRLRMRGSRCTLTYKGPAERAPYKSREELETDIEDADAFVKILNSLGYAPVFRYEKYRTTYTDGSGLITLDETIIGDFLELEGDGEWIDAVAAKLGHNPTQYITSSYARLYREYCEDHPEVDPVAMVF